jgi:hypothetical protein
MKNHLNSIKEFAQNSPLITDNVIENIMAAHDDRGLLKHFLRLGFFRKVIKEKDIQEFFRHIGWKYKIRSMPPMDQFDLYLWSIRKTGEVHTSVQCNSSTRTFWATKLFIEERHRRYRKSKGITSFTGSPEHIEMLSLCISTIAVVPPVELYRIYQQKGGKPTVEDIVQELNVVEPIAQLALDLFDHYYPKIK